MPAKKEKYLYPRGGLWWVKIPMGAGLKPKYESTGARVDNKKPERVPSEAIAYRDQLLAKKHRKEVTRSNGDAFIGELLDDLLNRWKKTRKESSANVLASPVERNLRPAFGKFRASRLTTAMLEAYREKRTKDGRAAATINRELAYLRIALRDGRRHTPPKVSTIPVFPMESEANNARTGFLDERQYDTFLCELRSDLRPALIIGYHVGMRLAEVLNLQWSWITPDGKHIQIPREIEKTGRGRTVPIFGGMCAAIEEAQRICNERYPECPWVINRNGRQIRAPKDAWKQAAIRAGIPGLLFHDLRRTAVRTMDRAGIPRRVIMEIIGHKTESMFLRYRIVDTTDIDRAAARMNEVFQARG